MARVNALLAAVVWVALRLVGTVAPIAVCLWLDEPVLVLPAFIGTALVVGIVRDACGDLDDE